MSETNAVLEVTIYSGTSKSVRIRKDGKVVKAADMIGGTPESTVSDLAKMAEGHGCSSVLLDGEVPVEMVESLRAFGLEVNVAEARKSGEKNGAPQVAVPDAPIPV
ncbi:MAG TPA: hypothetical protein VK504_25330 [Vicinamibacterales bacterium]|nr:hypothetical protein [Vicinamibacterales bacterium]